MLDGDQAVLLHLPSARRLVLSPTATRTWQLLLDHGDLETVLDVLVVEYNADPEQIEADVRRLVDQLRELDLIEESDD